MGPKKKSCIDSWYFSTEKIFCLSYGKFVLLEFHLQEPKCNLKPPEPEKIKIKPALQSTTKRILTRHTDKNKLAKPTRITFQVKSGYPTLCRILLQIFSLTSRPEIQGKMAGTMPKTLKSILPIFGKISFFRKTIWKEKQCSDQYKVRTRTSE